MVTLLGRLYRLILRPLIGTDPDPRCHACDQDKHGGPCVDLITWEDDGVY